MNIPAWISKNMFLLDAQKGANGANTEPSAWIWSRAGGGANSGRCSWEAMKITGVKNELPLQHLYEQSVSRERQRFILDPTHLLHPPQCRMNRMNHPLVPVFIQLINSHKHWKSCTVGKNPMNTFFKTIFRSLLCANLYMLHFMASYIPVAVKGIVCNEWATASLSVAPSGELNLACCMYSGLAMVSGQSREESFPWIRSSSTCRWHDAGVTLCRRQGSVWTIVSAEPHDDVPRETQTSVIWLCLESQWDFLSLCSLSLSPTYMLSFPLLQL